MGRSSPSAYGASASQVSAPDSGISGSGYFTPPLHGPPPSSVSFTPAISTCSSAAPLGSSSVTVAGMRGPLRTSRSVSNRSPGCGLLTALTFRMATRLASSAWRRASADTFPAASASTASANVSGLECTQLLG